MTRYEHNEVQSLAECLTKTTDPWVCTDRFWTVQHMDYDTKLALARSRTPHQCQTPIFSDLVGKILNKIHEQLRKLSHPLSQCSGTFRSAQRLPCAHDLLSIRQQ